MIVERNFIKTNFKSLRHEKNKEFVTGRVSIINKKKVIRISIGTIICDLVHFYPNDRINLMINKKDRNTFMIRKSIYPNDGYKLNFNCHSRNSSFMTFEFRYDSPEPFRIAQTIILDYEISDNGFLVINIEKLKWNN